MACQRHLDDLKASESEDYPWRFDFAKANRAIKFIETLPHTKDKWAQKKEKLILEPWQAWIVASIFGWLRKSDGVRRFSEAYIEVARKNGKSHLAAGIGLYCLLADGVHGAEVYSGATTEKQAWEVFRPAQVMAKTSPQLLEYYGLEVNAKSLVRLSDLSRFEPLIGKPGDGASPSCAIVDEFHEHDTSDLYDTMSTGMGARENPLMLVITTAGSNVAGPCYDKRSDVCLVLEGTNKADRMFGVIYSIDDGDDWKDPAVWKKANPNLGVSISVDRLELQVAEGIRQVSQQSSVLRKHFGVWTGSKSAWLNREHWLACGDATLRREDFAHDPCYIGLDLATRIDIAARIELYTREIGGQRHYYAFPILYLPDSALDGAKNAARYQGWVKEGFITLHDGDEIDLAMIQNEILALSGKVRLKEFAYDPWQATQMAQAIREQRIETIETRPLAKLTNPPMREIEAACASGRLHHPDNKCLTWMMFNVVAKPDANDNLFPRKEQPENKIDGAVALIYAMSRAMNKTGGGSVYESRGLLTL